ncbi:MAG: HyaD/HybD family hydrogenase maturation endopeptidase [Hyphomicrobiaceae bacterium]|nr:HyaD/HybD family hydrogenase maturation endopeptidase [Hyphomicrobiaceae bacterium]
MTTQPRVLVLGIGNLLWADEGFGVRTVEEFHRLYEVPENVRLLDGGTQGVYLVQDVREADILVVFDAVDYHLTPGAMKLIEGEDVPKFLGVKKISLHQTGFQEVLAMAEMMGDAPEHLYLIGVQPVELDDFGGGLRPEIKAQIVPAITEAIKYLKNLGIVVTKRSEPLRREDTIGCNIMSSALYESERPDEALACRIGDERLLRDENWQPPQDIDKEIDGLLSDTSLEKK